MRVQRTWSLRLRLSLFFAGLLLAVWSVTALYSWWESREYIDQFFDTQQMLFAKRLAAARYTPIGTHLPATKDMLHSRHADKGEQEDDALAFAVFRPDGSLLLSDGDAGRQFVFSPGTSGFKNVRVDGDRWRIVWLTSLDKQVVVAVGQELEYRKEMALEMLMGHMLPWLFALPALLLGLTWMLSRELAPLRSVAAGLAGREPNDLTPIDTVIQSEIQPLVQSLNTLFDRIGAMIRRERFFIAHAAHELRTPLAGLSIQAQVAQTTKQPAKREHALGQFRKGVSRASRLVDQLLLLSRLESVTMGESPAQAGEKELLHWDELLRESLEDYREQMETKALRVSLPAVEQESDADAVILGQRELLRTLLGNLVGNAVKYTPEKGEITLSLNGRGLVIQNSSREICPSDASRLGERFFRPAGQTEPGSGLGLSIVKRIADLHGMVVRVEVMPGLFSVAVLFPLRRDNGGMPAL